MRPRDREAFRTGRRIHEIQGERALQETFIRMFFLVLWGNPFNPIFSPPLRASASPEGDGAQLRCTRYYLYTNTICRVIQGCR